MEWTKPRLSKTDVNRLERNNPGRMRLSTTFPARMFAGREINYLGRGRIIAFMVTIGGKSLGRQELEIETVSRFGGYRCDYIRWNRAVLDALKHYDATGHTCRLVRDDDETAIYLDIYRARDQPS